MRIALISDIHEDIINLQLALDKIDRLQCDEIICLGDISGYSASHHDYLDARNALKCLRLVREKCALVIPGNHDLHAAFRTPKFSGFEYPEQWYEMDYWERAGFSKDKVWLYEQDELNPLYTHADINYLFDLPELAVKEYGDYHVLFTHYLYPNLTGSEQVFYQNPNEFIPHKDFMKKLNANISFTGHRHYAGIMANSDKTIINRSFGRSYIVKKGDVIHVPAITRANNNSGFMVFDDYEMSVQTFKI